MKKLAFLMLIAVLVLGLIASAVVAGGPANKATGSIWLDVVNDDWNRYMEFDAHAEKDGRPAKGTICWYQWLGPEELLEIIDPSFELEVKYVRVDDGTAWFAAGPDHRDYWLVVQVLDGGTPATGGDEVDLVWVTIGGTAGEDRAEEIVKDGETLDSVYTSIGGNLVVHFK